MRQQRRWASATRPSSQPSTRVCLPHWACWVSNESQSPACWLGGCAAPPAMQAAPRRLPACLHGTRQRLLLPGAGVFAAPRSPAVHGRLVRRLHGFNPSTLPPSHSMPLLCPPLPMPQQSPSSCTPSTPACTLCSTPRCAPPCGDTSARKRAAARRGLSSVTARRSGDGQLQRSRHDALPLRRRRYCCTAAAAPVICRTAPCSLYNIAAVGW